MLHANSVLPGTLELLKKISLSPECKSFSLAGGTSLALQIGHRFSVDLDFFSLHPVDQDDLLYAMNSLGKVNVLSRSKRIISVSIHGVKIDFVNYQYPFLKPPIDYDGIRLTGLEDIAAMKIAAITGRGRKRDFIDLYFLLRQFSLETILEWYKAKFNDGSEFLALKSLCYFEDAEMDESPQMLIACNWEEIKKKILKEVERQVN